MQKDQIKKSLQLLEFAKSITESEEYARILINHVATNFYSLNAYNSEYEGKSDGAIARMICNKYEPKRDKLNAVKELKALTGLGLRETKDIIDLMW